MLKPKSSRGSALIIALIVVVLIGGLATAMLTVSFSQSKTTYTASEAESSLNTSEAGLDDAINKLNALVAKIWKGDALITASALVVPVHLVNADDSTWSISKAVKGDPDYVDPSYDYYPLTQGQMGKWVQDPVTGVWSVPTWTTFKGTINKGDYDVTITPAFTGTVSNQLVGGVLKQVPTIYKITAHGSHNKEKKGISVYITPTAGNDLGDYGLVGKVTLTATSSNVFVDSFKSSAGTYASQATTTWTDGTTKYANTKGNLGSNGDIDVKNGIVFGSATPGPTSTVTIGKATITGATTPATNALDIPSVTYSVPVMSPSITTPKTWGGGPNGGAGVGGLGTTGVTTYLHYDSVVTSGSMKVSGTIYPAIQINGPVVMYVDGDIGMNAGEELRFNGPDASLTIYQKSGTITMNGGTYTGGATPLASKLSIQSATTGDVKFNGGADVYATVYAPDAAFRQTGTSVFYGKMVASTIDIGGNMTFHRDEDVNSSPSAPPVFKIKVMNETNY